MEKCTKHRIINITGIKHRLHLFHVFKEANHCTKCNINHLQLRGTNYFNYCGWSTNLVDPKGVALLPLPANSSVADADIPESLSLQLPVVSPGGEGLDREDLRPVVETFGVSGAGQAAFHPRDGAEVVGDAQQRVGRVGVQRQRTGHWVRGT